MRQESFEELRSEIIGDLTQMLPALEAGVAGIAVIIHYGGSLMASLAMHDSTLSGLRFHRGEDPAGTTYMCIVENPAQSPARWKRIPRHRLSAQSSWEEEMFPVGYFVLLMDGRTALAIPGRGRAISWSGNEELLCKVALILSDIGLLNKEKA
jgi:hypothetical protein